MNTFFVKLLEMSLQAGFVILVILMVRAIFSVCKVPKRFVYILWVIPFLRLICPWTLESPLSILPKQTNIMQITQVESDNAQMKSDMDKIYTKELPTWEAAVQYNRDNEDYGGDRSDVPVVKKELEAEFSTSALLETIWLAGVISLFIYSMISYIQLKQKLVGNICIRDNIYMTDYIDTPFVLGFIKPVIYLPSNIEERDFDYVIAHEQVHIRRKDYLIKIAAFLITCVHWFNPLAWFAFLCMGKDMEMSCDELVLRTLGEEQKGEYAKALLELTNGYRRISGVPLAFGEGNTKGRIKNIMKYKKTAAIVGVIAVVAMVGLSVVLLTSPQNDTDKNTTNITNEKKEEVTTNKQQSDYVMEGVYEMVATSAMDSLYSPSLTLYENKQFSFRYNPISSYLPYGEYVIENGIIIATTSDGLYQYKFRINDDGSLAYMNEQSPDQSMFDEKARVEIMPGSKFVRIFSSDVTSSFSLEYRSDGVDTTEKEGANTETMDDDEKEQIEIITPVVSEDTLFGADGPELDYVGEDAVIFHGYFGLFVYSTTEKKIIRSVDLKSIGCDASQGDNYCEVLVSEDGSKVYLNPIMENYMYVYHVEDNQLFKQKCDLNSLLIYSTDESIRHYLEEKNMFYAYQPLYIYLEECIAEGTMDASVRDYEGWRSINCVPMEIDGKKTCAYLEMDNYNIIDLYYVEDGIRVKVFEE